MHYSRLYHHAPMPFSIQVTGNCFIHGFKTVPDYPASHGCVRLPISKAQQFYEWAEPGMRIDITGKWVASRAETGSK